MNNNHIIEQILANADIVKIIGKHVELKRSGNEYKGCCPFHGEKTPSFFVNPQKNLYNCFGCGVKGNALTFLKEYENLTAGEALRELSRQTGIELPKEQLREEVTYKRASSPSAKPKDQIATSSQTAPQSEEEIDKSTDDNQPQSAPPSDNQTDLSVTPPSIEPTTSNDTRDSYQSNIGFDDSLYSSGRTEIYTDNSSFSYDEFAPFVQIEEQDDGTSSLYDLLTQISVFYQHQLAQSNIAQQYFLQRGLTLATIQEFGLGYAPDGWQHLEQAFPKDIEGLKILGLLRTSQKGNAYSLLRHRVIFPIRDNQGRIVGFAGRALNDEDMPKYINSSDSPVFHKQHILYGLYEGRKAKAKDWLVVEGYMDVISLHQAGVYGAVASMGTAIATSQVERLLQLNPVLTLSFDGDSAGQKAGWRAMEVALPVLTDGKELRFLTLPNNHDPDSFVKAYGKAAMQSQLAQAVPMSQYVFAVLSRRYDISIAEGRNKLLADVSELTRKLPKGSYGWLLREDMRSRMGLGKRAQARMAHDALLNFDSFLTKQLLLEMCFLYQPSILGNRPSESNSRIDLDSLNPVHVTARDNAVLNQSLIQHIYYLSRAFKVFMSLEDEANKQPHQNLKSTKEITDANNLPNALANLIFFQIEKSNLPRDWQTPFINRSNNIELLYYYLNQRFIDSMLTWQEIADEELLQLIDWIQYIQPQLFAIGTTIDDDFERINAKAHYILAGMPQALQQKLIVHWYGFFDSLSQRSVTDVSILIIEGVVPMLLDVLNKPIKTATQKDFVRLKTNKALSQTIFNWYQKWQQQKDD